MCNKIGKICALATFIFLLSSTAAGANDIILGDKARVNIARSWSAAVNFSFIENDTVSWVGALAGNGYKDRRHKHKARNTIIFAPGSITSNQTDIILYFHGLTGFKKSEFLDRVVPTIHKLHAQGRNFVLVFPELPWSYATYTPRGRQRAVWNPHYSKHENLVMFYQNVLKTIGTINNAHFSPRNTIIVGHSAGGSAIRMAARFGGLKHIKPVRVIFSDAGYGRWTDEAWKHYLSKHPACSFVLLTRVWDKPWHNTRRFLRGNFRKVIPANIELYEFPRRSYTHSTIGNQAITWAYEAADTTLRVSVESVVRR